MSPPNDGTVAKTGPGARRAESGASMLEVLVAVVILLLAVSSALAMYDIILKSFRKTENVTEQQQGVRAGFDKVVADLQLAGLNHIPDGSATCPDEQIEAAFGTALVVRADFDAQDPTLSTTPESSLAGGAFSSVSVGNDEIVALVLAKPDGSSSGTLTFSADVAQNQRDGAVDAVTIPNVDLAQSGPPYALYRITLNNDVSTFGTNAFFVRTPLIENVKSLSFRYYDANGNLLAAPGGDETAAAIEARAKIRRIQVDVVGLTPDPDMNWRDVSDTNPATRAYRKMRLVGDVKPRNLGYVATRDLAP